MLLYEFVGFLNHVIWLPSERNFSLLLSVDKSYTRPCKKKKKKKTALLIYVSLSVKYLLVNEIEEIK